MSDLRVVIGAEIGELQSRLASAKSKVTDFATTTDKASKAAGQSIFNLTEKLRVLQSNIFTEKDRGKIAAYNQQIKATEAEISKLNSLGTQGGLAAISPQFENIGKGATKALSAVRNLAYILPGIGIAGILAFATEPIIHFVSALFGATEESKRLAKQQEEISKSFVKAGDDAAEEISKVTVLKAVLESENATRLQKITALKELKKINPDYFGQLDLEHGKVAGLTIAYEGYIQKLLRSINAKANVDLLTEALKRQNEAIAKANQNVNAGSLKFKAEDLTEFQVQDAIRRFGLTFGAGKGQSVIIDFNEKKLIADILNAESDVRNITSLIKQNVQDAFTPDIEKIKKVREKVTKDMRNYIISDEGLFGVKEPVFNKRIIVNIHSILKTDLAGYDKQAHDIADKLTEITNNALQDSIGKLAEGFGDILGGNGSFKNLFSGIYQVLGSGLQELGKYLIKTYALIKAIEQVKFKNAAVGIAVGFALEVLGATIKSRVQSNNAFASGVRGFSGGMALVGERGPERIFLPAGSSVQPNNELSAYGGGREIFIPAVTLSGPDLVIAFNRASAAMGRNN